MRDKIIALIPWTLVLIGFVVAYIFVSGVGRTARENSVYTRYTACVLSIKPAARGDAEIQRCWQTVTTDADYYPKKYETQGY